MESLTLRRRGNMLVPVARSSRHVARGTRGADVPGVPRSGVARVVRHVEAGHYTSVEVAGEQEERTRLSPGPFGSISGLFGLEGFWTRTRCTHTFSYGL